MHADDTIETLAGESAARTKRSFLAALAASERPAKPYRHWLLHDALPLDVARAITALSFEAPRIDDTQGKRETHNSTRVFASVENQSAFPVMATVAQCFQSPEIVGALEGATGAPLAGSNLRIEYCQDSDRFWLEPHTDIGAKLFTMLIYLSEHPDAVDWGTDIYDNDLKHLGRAPGGFNRGLIFIPATDTWHGVEKRAFNGIRKSIIVNYVKPEWRSRQELAFPDLPVMAG